MSERHYYYRRGTPPPKKTSPGKKLLLALLLLVLFLGAGAGGFLVFGGTDLFTDPPAAYYATGEVRAFSLAPPEDAADKEAMLAYFEQAVDHAELNGYNTLVFTAKDGLAVWWRDNIFPPVEQVKNTDTFFEKNDPLLLLCQALEGHSIQLWLAVDTYGAAGYYPDARGKAAALAAEKGGATLLSFAPDDTAYHALLAQSLAGLPKKYPLAGVILQGFATSGQVTPAAVESGLPALLQSLQAAMDDTGLVMPVGLAFSADSGALSSQLAAAQVNAGAANLLLPALSAGPHLSQQVAALSAGAAPGSLVLTRSGQGDEQVFFTAGQSTTYGGALYGTWPAITDEGPAIALLESALIQVDASLPSGFDIPQILAINYPAQNAKIYTEELFIVGTSDPSLPLIFNGAEVTNRAENGAFGVLAAVASGENSYTLAQGENTLTLKVEQPVSTGGGGGTTPADSTQRAPAGQAVRVANTFAGALKDPPNEASMNETLPTGAAFIVQDNVQVTVWSSDRGRYERTWVYQMPSGDWVMAYNCEWLNTDGKSAFTGIAAQPAEDGEYLLFEGTGSPAAYVAYDDETGKLTLTFYDTSFSLGGGFASTYVSGAEVEPGADGAVRLTLQTQGIWGYNLEYGDGTTRLHLKEPPVLSGDLQRPLAGVRIMLDPGHGGSDIGAPGLMGDGGPNEKDINLALARTIAYRLRQLGAEVLMTRDDDTYSTTMERLELENAEKPDFFIAVHHNAMEMDRDLNGVHGVESYYYHPYSVPNSKLLAQNLMDCVSAATGRTARNDGLAKWGYYNVVRTTACPSVLFEYGFVGSPAEFEDITSADGLYNAALGTAEAVLRSMPGYSAVYEAPAAPEGEAEQPAEGE